MNNYISQFEENLNEIENLIATPESIRKFAIENIKNLDNDECLKNVGKNKLKHIISALENISDETIKKHYQIIYNQLCVLAVSALSATLENYFIEFIQNNLKKLKSFWKELRSQRKEPKINVSLYELLEKYNLTLEKFIGRIILEKDNSINFQDLQSIIRTFKVYCNKKN